MGLERDKQVIFSTARIARLKILNGSLAQLRSLWIIVRWLGVPSNQLFPATKSTRRRLSERHRLNYATFMKHRETSLLEWGSLPQRNVIFSPTENRAGRDPAT